MAQTTTMMSRARRAHDESRYDVVVAARRASTKYAVAIAIDRRYNVPENDVVAQRVFLYSDVARV